MNNINDSEFSNQLDKEYPIISQTSEEDKIVLLKLKKIIQNIKDYSYLEIGTYLGGSLTPFINDPQCKYILSIDDREKATPDDRGNKINYINVKQKEVIKSLKKYNLNIDKIDFFDGSINEIKNVTKKFDLCFIDAEHTDTACFRDFIYTVKLIKEDAIILLHDSHIVYKAIIMINDLLISEKRNFKFIKILNSSMSIFFFNKFADEKFLSLFNYEKNMKAFYALAEKNRLEANLKNRVKVSLSLNVEDVPIKKKVY
tara:strand:- start:55 stop:825 length:771 start_codon:yes stop_codon:yes gene_type:complete